MRGGSQPLHGSADSIALPKHGRPGDQHVGSCADDQGRRRRVDAAVNFEVAAGLKRIDHLADTPNLGQCRVDCDVPGQRLRLRGSRLRITRIER